MTADGAISVVLSKRWAWVLWLAGYLASFGLVAGLLLNRNWQEQNTPAAQTSGGMWAFGDFLLGLFCLGILATLPAFQVMRAWSRNERSYRKLLIALAAFSTTAIPCWGLAYFFPVPHSLPQLLVLVRITILAVTSLGASLINLICVFRSPLRKWPLITFALEAVPLLVFSARLIFLSGR